MAEKQRDQSGKEVQLMSISLSAALLAANTENMADAVDRNGDYASRGELHILMDEVKQLRQDMATMKTDHKEETARQNDENAKLKVRIEKVLNENSALKKELEELKKKKVSGAQLIKEIKELGVEYDGALESDKKKLKEEVEKHLEKNPQVKDALKQEGIPKRNWWKLGVLILAGAVVGCIVGGPLGLLAGIEIGCCFGGSVAVGGIIGAVVGGGLSGGVGAVVL